jgi:Na+/proline symporter
LVAVAAANGGVDAIAQVWTRSWAGAQLHAPEGIWTTIEAWLVPIVGSVTAQELASRVLACRDATVARRSTLLAAGLYLLVGLIPVTLGLMGTGLVSGLEDAESILPELASRYLGTLGQIVLLGALISAILSTVDSNLLASAALMQNSVVTRLWPAFGNREQLAATRGWVVGTGVLAWFLATSRSSVYELVREASAFGGGGMAVAMAFGLLGRFGGARAALGAMAVSLAVQVIGTYVWRLEAPMTTSCVVSLLLFVGIAIGDRRRPAPVPA